MEADHPIREEGEEGRWHDTERNNIHEHDSKKIRSRAIHTEATLVHEEQALVRPDGYRAETTHAEVEHNEKQEAEAVLDPRRVYARPEEERARNEGHEHGHNDGKDDVHGMPQRLAQ